MHITLYTHCHKLSLSTWLIILGLCVFQNSISAQRIDGYDPVQTAAISPHEDFSPSSIGLDRSLPSPNHPNHPDAMWDVQFKFAQNDSVPLSHSPRVYGLVWTGTEFWGTPWNSPSLNYMDSIYRYDRTGRFLGVLKMINSSGMRGMTLSNGAIWASNTADSIYKISLQTGQVIKKVKTQTVGGVRFITADPMGNLWVGNFSTAIWQIDTNGTILKTVPLTTHGLSGMSGAAYDSVSSGGPFLWVNCQSSRVAGAPAGTYIRVFKINPDRSLTIERDVKLDAADVGTSAAGGMTIAQIPGLTQRSLISVSQNANAPNTGRVVAYELNFTPPQVPDLGVDSVGIRNAFYLVPQIYVPTIGFSGKISNNGFVTTPAGAKVSVEIFQGSTFISSKNVPLNIGSFANQVVQTTGYSNLPVGDYDARFLTEATGDPVQANDTTRVLFGITDSTMGRDLSDRGLTISRIGSGGVQTANPRRIGMKYWFPSRVTINSVTMQYRAANTNDTLHIGIFRIVNGQPTDSIGGTVPFVTVAQDSISPGTRRTFRLRAPLTLNPTDTVLIASCEDGRGIIFVWSTAGSYPTNSVWAYRQSYVSSGVTIPTGWYSDTTTMGTPVVKRGYAIRPNLNMRVGNQDLAKNIAAMQLAPNPTNGYLHLSLSIDDSDKVQMSIFDVTGKAVYTEGVLVTQNLEKDFYLNQLPSGMYMLKIQTEKGGAMFRKFIKN